MTLYPFALFPFILSPGERSEPEIFLENFGLAVLRGGYAEGGAGGRSACCGAVRGTTIIRRTCPVCIATTTIPIIATTTLGFVVWWVWLARLQGDFGWVRLSFWHGKFAGRPASPKGLDVNSRGCNPRWPSSNEAPTLKGSNCGARAVSSALPGPVPFLPGPPWAVAHGYSR